MNTAQLPIVSSVSSQNVPVLSTSSGVWNPNVNFPMLGMNQMLTSNIMDPYLFVGQKVIISVNRSEDFMWRLTVIIVSSWTFLITHYLSYRIMVFKMKMRTLPGSPSFITKAALCFLQTWMLRLPQLAIVLKDVKLYSLADFRRTLKVENN